MSAALERRVRRLRCALGGAQAVVIAPLARLLRPDRVPSHATFLALVRAREPRCVRGGLAQALAGTE